MNAKKVVLQIVAIALIILGILRVLANESTFELFRNKDLWLGDVMMMYIFKAGGAFILFHGIIFYSISKEYVRFRSIFGPYAFGLLVAGTAMLLVGYFNFLPVWIYLSDALFSYFLAIFCFYVRS